MNPPQQRSTLIFLLAASFILAGCATPPRTADEAFQQCRVRPQSNGNVNVIGPVLQYRVGKYFGYASFNAAVQPQGIDYFLKSTLLRSREGADSEVAHMPREQLEYYRKNGTVASAPDTRVTVPFPPYYFEGFLRRVDSIPKPAVR